MRGAGRLLSGQRLLPQALIIAAVCSQLFRRLLDRKEREGRAADFLKTNIGQLDNNSDGRIDTEFDYNDGLLTRGRYDRNFDGAWDYWERYENGQIQQAEVDNNFDHKVDGWLSHKHGNVEESRRHLDDKGVADMISSYRHARHLKLARLFRRPDSASNYDGSMSIPAATWRRENAAFPSAFCSRTDRRYPPNGWLIA